MRAVESFRVLPHVRNDDGAPAVGQAALEKLGADASALRLGRYDEFAHVDAKSEIVRTDELTNHLNLLSLPDARRRHLR